jgi:hypothetical protein
MDFYVVGAWFDNHFTLRRGDLYYNGVLCAPFGRPLDTILGPPRKPVKLDEEIEK